MTNSLQAPFDVAIVIATIVRPTLAQAIHSVYAQRFDGRIQVMLGIDRWEGERALVEQLVAQRPSHIAVTTLDLGYSTSQRNGGQYPSAFGGALKTILSFAANSRHVAYLDDDNFYEPDHLSTLLAAIDGRAWAFSLRNFVDGASDAPLCVDTWESVGPGVGVYRDAHGGFVDANCYLIDARQCSDVFPEWAMTRYPGGSGGDRQVFEKLRERPWGTNNAPTLHYRVRLARQHPYQLWRFRCAGVDLARYLAPDDIPSDDVWRRCAAFDRGQRATPAQEGPGDKTA
ncbi:MAG: glycosyltransferase family 2 protein [Casimicrobiaceae bacterium]